MARHAFTLRESCVEPRDLKPDAPNPELENRFHTPEPRNPIPATQARNPKPHSQACSLILWEMRCRSTLRCCPKPTTLNSKSEIKNVEIETRNPKPETPNHELRPPNPNPPIPNSKPKTTHPEPGSPNPADLPYFSDPARVSDLQVSQGLAGLPLESSKSQGRLQAGKLSSVEPAGLYRIQQHCPNALPPRRG